MKTEKQKIGQWGEDQASLFLSRQGYEIVDKNYQVKQGEIDIIAWHNKYHFGKTLCFIEVKTRSYGGGFHSELVEGSAERATRKQKLPKLFQAARCYCLDNDIDIDHMPIQFEHVSVYVFKKSGKVKFRKYVILMD